MTSELGFSQPDRSVERIAAVDVIKVAAIVAVVLQHAGPLRIWRDSFSEFDIVFRLSWIQYHVPAFLMVAGFLAAKKGLHFRAVSRSLVRVLVPYLLASVLAQLMGYSGAAGDPQKIALQLATGASLGIYYYIFLYVVCMLIAWPLSYLRPTLLWCLLAGLYLYALGAVVNPRLAFAPLNVSIGTRNPLNFGLAYFLTGWVVSQNRDAFARLAAEWRRPLQALALVAIAVGVTLWATDQVVWIRQFVRPFYSVAVVGLLATISWRKPLPGLVTFLSECTLGIFLFHLLFLIPLLRPTMHWAPPLRTALCFGVALAASCLLGWLSRSLLGPLWSRRLLGF